MKDLIIVESPSKAKTITKYLGGDYKVVASKGHIMDLPKSSLGIDVEDGFKPSYVVSPGKTSVISEIKKDLPEKGIVYIASDPDREGEAIGWHVAQSVGLISEDGRAKKVRGKDIQLKRIVFHEITKNAILDSFKHARSIDMNLVDAQQARRILDRLVGYKLSPLLWTKIRYGLSAGRVQSVAVRLVVERERERDAFQSKEYWSVEGTFKAAEGEFSAMLQKINGKKFEVGNKKDTDDLVTKLQDSTYKITSVTSKQVKRHPSPPFITSTMQQEANRKLGFSAKKTMSVAQKLYEGVSTKEGNTALITYMRTDSYNLSDGALQGMREYIEMHFGKEYMPQMPNYYKKKSRFAQEAHEAIRPVDIRKTPAAMKSNLTTDEFKLYDLIWKRTLASQMSDGIFDSLGIDVVGEKDAQAYLFRATGQKVVFPGFIKVYIESKDDEETSDDILDSLLPAVKENESVDLLKLNPEQHFTQPPARFSEAILVKSLEENGIGRPSTYAPILSTIVDRGYVEKEGKYFKPLDVGYVVNDLLVKHFSTIVDIGFTSDIEKEFDEIAEGERKYADVLEDFYGPFEKNLEAKQKEIKKEDVVVLGKSDEKCPECGKPMVIKLGKYGRFLSCSDFPTCKGMKSLDENDNKPIDEKCQKCGSPLVIKMSKKGVKFYGCSKYPECDFTQAIPTGLICELCGAPLVQRKSKWGKMFYGCSRFPDCRFILSTKKAETATSEEKEG